MSQTSHEHWDATQLEHPDGCPVCACIDRELLYAELIDKAFRTAAGTWQLWACVNCGSAYLDPRPSEESIHLAYAEYYTHAVSHETVRLAYDGLTIVQKLRRRLANGYMNWRYSTSEHPSTALGILAAQFIRGRKLLIDREYRHLPRLPETGGNLLDVGCGDGSFLKLARQIGWHVCGVDTDPDAAASADPELDIRLGGIECFNDDTELFDVITLNHVIEHVYQPVKLLERCFELLRDGGQIWIETPNIASAGHKRFRENWRGLEPPRHLTLFNEDSIKHALSRAGFRPQTVRFSPGATLNMYQKSYALSIDQSPYEPVSLPANLAAEAKRAGLLSLFLPGRREFLTISAIKDGLQK